MIVIKKDLFVYIIIMKTFYIKIISNTIFYLVLGFFAFYLFLAYFFERKLALFLSIYLSFILSAVYLLVSSKKHKIKTLKAKELKRAKSFIDRLCFLDGKLIVEKFFNQIRQKYLSAKLVDNAVYLPFEKKMLFFNFNFDGLTKTDIVRAYNCLPCGASAVIYYYFCSNEVKDFANRFSSGVTLEEGASAYKYVQNTPFSLERPPKEFNNKKPRKPFMSKKIATKFLFFGLLFLSFSFFVSIKIYYLVFGFIFILLSLISRFFY